MIDRAVSVQRYSPFVRWFVIYVWNMSGVLLMYLFLWGKWNDSKFHAAIVLAIMFATGCVLLVRKDLWERARDEK